MTITERIEKWLDAQVNYGDDEDEAMGLLGDAHNLFLDIQAERKEIKARINERCKSDAAYIFGEI